MLEVLFQNESLQFLLIIGISVAAAFVIDFIILRFIRKFAGKTKNDIDDALADIVKKPLLIAIILAGLFFAQQRLSLLVEYQDLISKGFFVVSVLLGAYIFVKILLVFVGKWLHVKKKFRKTPQVLNKVIAGAIYLIAFIIILSYFGIEVSPLIATLGIGGLAVGLALQNTLSNFFAGLHIISDQPVQVGDYIELQSENITGYVDDIGWRSTRILTLPNTLVIIPNAKLAESVIINDDVPVKETGLVIPVGVGYKEDLKKVEKVTVEVARKIQENVEGAVRDFEPFIRYNSFGDSNINFAVILRVQQIVDKYLVTHEFIKALKERYDKENIEISWPVRKIVKG